MSQINKRLLKVTFVKCIVQNNCCTTETHNIWSFVVICGHLRSSNLSSRILNVLDNRRILTSIVQHSLDQRDNPQPPGGNPADLIGCYWTCLFSSLRCCCCRRTQTPRSPEQCPSPSLNCPPGTERLRRPRLRRGDSDVCTPGSLQGEELWSALRGQERHVCPILQSPWRTAPEFKWFNWQNSILASG